MLMFDHAFNIFNNLQPRFDWSEIDVSFSSDPECFSGTCAHCAAGTHVSGRKLPIKQTFQRLFASDGDDLLPLKGGVMNSMDMMVLIHCEAAS